MDQDTATLERVRDEKTTTDCNPIVEMRRQRYAPDLSFSKKQARRHLELLHEDGDGEAAFTFFTADDRKDIPKDRKRVKPAQVYHNGDKLPARSWYGTLDDSWERAKEENREGRGIFVCIQRMDNSGNRETKNVLGIRTCVNDLDHGDPPKPYPRTPSFSVLSSMHGRHDYFLAVSGELTTEQYKAVQGGLAKEYGGDKQVTDVTRVMRLAGTNHRKTQEPYLCTVVESDAEEVSIYRGKHLVETFGEAEKGAASKSTANRDLTLTNIGAAIDALKPTRRYSVAQVTEALGVLSDEADDRATWVEYGLAMKRSYGEQGKAAWLEWSATSEFFNETDAEQRWDTFNVEAGNGVSRPKTVGSIIRAAQAKGWEPKGVVTVVTAWPDTRNDKPDPGSAKNVGFFLDTIGAEPWYNEFDRKTYVRNAGGRDQCISDDVLRDLRLQMHEAGCRASPELFIDAVLWLGQKRTAHPPRHYLEEQQAKWDGKPRLDTWLTKYVGVEDKPYTRTIGRKWMLGGVRRVRQPGCKFDNVLVLEGPEYAGKSRVFKILAGDWFTDGVNLGDNAREVIENTAGSWIVECQELSGLGRRDIEAVKAFATRQVDRARAAYGRVVSDIPRQFILGGTTNESRYLMSKTGNRRFWCADVGKIDLDALAKDRDQLWAEAAHYEALGERIYLTRAEFDQAAHEQKKREVVDPVEERLSDLIAGIADGFIATECLYAAIGLQDASKRKDAHPKIIARVMRLNEWVTGRRRCGSDKRQRGYFNGQTAELSDWWEYSDSARKFRERKD